MCVMQEELESNADSVNYLITQLCRSIACQYGLDATAATDVHKLKSQSFEILLKKSKRPHVYIAPGEEDDFDPQRTLDMHIFAARLHAKAHPQECAKFTELEQQLATIEHEPYFVEGSGRGLLQLLLELQGNLREKDEIPITHQPVLLVPGPFTLFAEYEHNQHYPKQQTYDWLDPKPRFFKGVHNSKNADNPYLPKYLIDNTYNKLAEIDRKYAPTTTRSEPSAEDCTFTALTRRLLGGSVCVNINSYRLFGDCGVGLLPRIQPNLHLKLPKPKPSKENDNALPTADNVADEPRILSWNWESLGCFGIRCAKPFASEANVALDLQCYKNKMQGLPFEAKILTKKQFLLDLKALTAGIQSDTFQHDEYIIFDMEENITVDGLLPATIRAYVVDFLECGTCYKRLQTMIMKRDHKLMFDGFIFRALCSAIDEYLLTFRQYVFALHDDQLMAYYARMYKMMKQISNLSYTLAIHPKVEAHQSLPMGSQFLGYLYREIVRITEKDFIILLVYILKRCCHVYFKHLQKWIYYGLLDDPSNELFISFVDHYRPNTKYFYDKAYSVRKDAVPGFFQTYEDQILQCGKYTMLLKTCKPTHPLFNLKYPAISVCLTFSEIEKLKDNCLEYKKQAQKICGNTIVSIRKMFEARADSKRQSYQRACQRSRENIDRWTDEQNTLALLAAEQKKRRLDELTTQLQDAKQRKVAERRANVELELRLLRETEKLDEQRMLRENINLRKRIEYYQELSDMMRIDVKDNKNTQVKGAHEKNTTQSQKSSNESATQQPQTPISGGTDTDFESCCGDEDAISLYAECLSDEFVQRFAENEQVLHAICNEGTAEEGDIRATEQEQKDVQIKEIIETSSEASLYSALGVAAESNTLLTNCSNATFLKRSASDVINSNEIVPSIPVSISSTTITILPATLQVKTGEKSLTEAQRNKMRVLAHEFGTIPTSSTMPDINLNTLPDSELTDLQRNRKRMMQNDIFAEYNKSPLADRANLNLNLDTDRARNRRRVLESEFNILTGYSPSATTFTVEHAITPMSTTSDTPITESASTAAATADVIQKNDWDNGNVLKINVELATEEQQVQAQKKQQQSNTQSSCNTAGILTIAETPDCALNTAGLHAKQGFDFVDAEKLKKQQQDVANEVPIHPDQLPEEAVCPTIDYSQPYKRSMELIESNFKCASRTPFIRLKVAGAPQTLAVRKSNETLQQLKLNSMSAITLTEFLQKSVVIPMSTHLELVNNEVMRMFLEDLHVLDHLRSLRYYYFLMDGEFGAIICDGIIGKLESGASPVKLLNYQMLHAILDTALGSSMIGKEKNAENLSFIVNDTPKKFDLTSPDVLNVLCLSYHIDWPLNLILNPETLEQYGNIFKYLMKVRRISWVLERAYQILKEAVKKNGNELLKSPQYRHVQQIRHKFYHFVHALQNHITGSALQASWKTFKDELLQAKTIEDIYRKHTVYVKRILFLCMLNRHSAEFYNAIENIFKISLRFYNNLKSRDFKRRDVDEHYTHSRYEKLSNDEHEFDKFIKFTIYLGNKIVSHGYQEEIGEFINLINFNQYYTTSTSN